MKNRNNNIKKDTSQVPKSNRASSLINFLDRITSHSKSGKEILKSRHLFIGSAAIIFLLMLFLGMKAGINGDDYFQNSYSDKVTKFYSSFGKDTSCFDHPDAPIKYYGGLFELITGSINQSFGLDVNDADYHHVRHLINIFFGFCCIVMLGLWLRLSGGWVLASLGMWLLFISPRFTGHATMNPKDIPFAAGYLMALYFLSKLIRSFPDFKWRSVVGLSLGIGIAVGIRIGGLILFGIVGLFFGIKLLKYLLENKNVVKRKTIGIAIGKILLSLVFGLGIGLLFWPFGLLDPLSHIPEALSELTHIGEKIRVLFNGKDYFGNQLPWYYHLLWIFYTIPISVLLGILLLITFLKFWIRKTGMMDMLISAFAFVFPLMYIIARGSTVHDGWRHVLFVYPPLVYLAACGWYAAISKFRDKKKTKYILISLLTVSMMEAGVFMFRNTSHPYVYFNPIIGGIDGARGWFELDYWGVTAGEAADLLIKNGIVNDQTDQPVIVATNFEYPVRIKLSRFPNVKVNYIKYRERHFQHWDYGIFVSRFIPGIQLRKGIWPPGSQKINSIKANGVDLTVILHNEDDAIFRGDQLVQRGAYEEAVNLLLEEVKKHPENEFIWIDLGYSYQYLQNYRAAEDCLRKALIINPHSVYANNFLAYNYLLEGKDDQSIQLFTEAIDMNEVNDIAHFFLAQLMEKKGDHSTALTHGLKAIEINANFKQAYELVAQIYLSSGDPENAERYQNIAQSMN